MAVKQAQMSHPAMGAPQPWGSANGRYFGGAARVNVVIFGEHVMVGTA